MNQYTINVPAAGAAPGVANVHCSGKYFKVSALTAAFDLMTSNNDQYSFNTTASGFGDDISPRFGSLSFYNNTGAINTIVFYVSDSPISLADVNLTNAVTVQTALTNTLAICALENEIHIQTNCNVAGYSYVLANAGTYFRRVTLIAQKDDNATPNAGKVYLSNAVAKKTIVLNPGSVGANGDIWELAADTGGKRDLGNWRIQADNAGDGVTILGV